MRKLFSLVVLCWCVTQSFAATIAVPTDYSTITAAITAATDGDTVLLSVGTYQENVLIDREITLEGVDRESVIIQPFSLGVSGVILVQANNVTVSTLTIDGDNPALISGKVFSGADIDVSRGISTKDLSGVQNNLVVRECLVKNVLVYGISALTGGSFLFEGNEVRNVKAYNTSVGMYSDSGAGIFRDNIVSDCWGAIASLYSKGILYEDNVVHNSLIGISSDNNGLFFGSADTIQNNHVYDSRANGYGIFVRVPYRSVSVLHNEIENVDTGIACSGRPNTGYTPLHVSDNTIDGKLRPHSTGFLIAPPQSPFGFKLLDVFFTSNTITRTENAVYLRSIAGFVISVTGSFNRIVSNTSSSVFTVENQFATYHANWEHNWWGCNDGPTCSSVSSVVDATPWLVLDSKSTDAQLASGAITDVTARILYTSDGVDTRSLGRIPPVPASFQSTLGSILPASATLSSGSASARFTAELTGGFASVLSLVDNASTEIFIEILPTPTPNEASLGVEDWVLYQ